MVKTEGKWPKELKKWRIVRRDKGDEVTYQCQANMGFWSGWQDLGPTAVVVDDNNIECECRLHDWICEQCEQHKKVEETVVWKGK